MSNETSFKGIIILFGPSGCGKSTVEKKLIKDGYQRLASFTNRERRQGELDGIDYIFLDGNVDIHKDDIAVDYKVGGNSGWHYGILKKTIDEIQGYCFISIISLDYAKDLAHYIANRYGANKVKIAYLKIPDDIRFERLIERDGIEQAIYRMESLEPPIGFKFFKKTFKKFENLIIVALGRRSVYKEIKCLLKDWS